MRASIVPHESVSLLAATWAASASHGATPANRVGAISMPVGQRRPSASVVLPCAPPVVPIGRPKNHCTRQTSGSAQQTTAELLVVAVGPFRRNRRPTHSPRTALSAGVEAHIVLVGAGQEVEDGGGERHVMVGQEEEALVGGGCGLGRRRHGDLALKPTSVEGHALLAFFNNHIILATENLVLPQKIQTVQGVICYAHPISCTRNYFFRQWMSSTGRSGRGV
ncbi:hypothetical protein GUJ93_ZPchr0009g1478 [Zizania palustris]|uniref:Uncharacterized protein n=1 Tax=Zizania palustris TaxID=103762 RepID=A0A8J5RKU6_ZIZPA|nr:hypothetical protein GUJ93_ZPchr0009g1478 [Zizania palustris]